MIKGSVHQEDLTITNINASKIIGSPVVRTPHFHCRGYRINS